MDWLPSAQRDPHGAVLPWAVRTHPKCALHTTEGPGWPDYQGWKIPPHLTVLPHPGVGVEVRQHIPFSRASFALEHPAGGVETNRADVVQVEMIGTCDPAQKARLYYWPEADGAVLADLFTKVIKPISDGLGIPLKSLRWMAYPDSYGATNGVRLQGADWLAYSGFLGHQHAAGNHHGDPGAFPWDRMISAIGDDMPLTDADARVLAKNPEFAAAVGVAARDAIMAVKYGQKADGTPHTLADVWAETLLGVNALRGASSGGAVIDASKVATAIVAELGPQAATVLATAVRQAVVDVLHSTHAS